MDRKLTVGLVLFTAIICFFFLISNPVLSTEIEDLNFSEGEVFEPCNGSYDFRIFTLNDSNTSSFRVKFVESGHVLLVDETGNKVINIIQFEKMINFKKDSSRDFINGELSKTGWMVDGVEVHEVEFRNGDSLYSACTKDTSTGTLIYLATPSDAETAAMLNSLAFKG